MGSAGDGEKCLRWTREEGIGFTRKETRLAAKEQLTV